jgi:hypoxanthine phosphoribosyltransferase
MSKEHIEVLLSEEKISARVKQLAAEITRDYAGKDVTLVGTLKGAVIFLADLAREIKLEVQMEFIKVSSYGNNSESDGEVRLEYPLQIDFTGRHIILVEDIVDMGYTARWLRKYFLAMNPASLKLCALLDKPDRRKVAGVEIEYLGFSIPDEFVVGYGLDYAQRYRCLPYVGKLRLE